MPWSFDNHDCRGDSTSCMYCLSDIQQAEQVEKLFKLSYHNRNKNRENYETPPTITNTPPLRIASSNLGNILHGQFNESDLQAIGQQTLDSSVSLSETSNDNQNGSESSSVDTIGNTIPLKTGTTQVFVQIIIPQVVSDGVLVSNPSTISLPVNTLSICESQPSEQNSVQPFQFTNVLSDTSRVNDRSISKTQTYRKRTYIKCRCPNCNVEGGNKTRDFDGKPIHVCHIDGCTKVFKNTAYLRDHLIAHTQKKNIFCAYCNKRFSRKSDLMKHLKKHTTGKRQYTCHILNCGQVFNRVKNLNIHLDWHKGKESFSCAQCPRIFSRRDKMIAHVQTHANTQRDELENPEFQVSQKSKRQTICKCQNCTAVGGNKSRGPDGKFQHICHIPHCGKVFNIAKNLRIHLDWHAGKPNFTCARCNKGFYQKNNFKEHLRKHEKDKVSASNINRVRLSKEDSRSTEIQTIWTNIENIRPQLFCRIAGCQKIYYYQKDLTTHLKWDHGVKPHVCTWPSCERTFNLPQTLKKHLESHQNKQNLNSML